MLHHEKPLCSTSNRHFLLHQNPSAIMACRKLPPVANAHISAMMEAQPKTCLCRFCRAISDTQASAGKPITPGGGCKTQPPCSDLGAR